jgi:DNA-binding MarR family transcriptional regulator
VTQAQVARFAATDENMTSQVIRSLAERGLLTRAEHPTDARARCLELTGEGQQLLAQAKAAVRPARDKFFAPLGDRAAALAQLLREIAGAEHQADQ